MNVCICTIDSPCCTAETKITLEGNYTPTKINTKIKVVPAFGTNPLLAQQCQWGNALVPDQFWLLDMTLS